MVRGRAKATTSSGHQPNFTYGQLTPAQQFHLTRTFSALLWLPHGQHKVSYASQWVRFISNPIILIDCEFIISKKLYMYVNNAVY